MKYDRAFHVEMPIKGNTGMLLSEQPLAGEESVGKALPEATS